MAPFLSFFLLNYFIGCIVGEECFTKEFKNENGLVKYRSYEYQNQCSLQIRSSNKKKYVRMKFTEFHMSDQMPNCHSDKITVYTGCVKRTMVGEFCSSKYLPHDIYSLDGCIQIIVQVRSNQEQLRFFTAEYWSVPKDNPESIKCKPVVSVHASGIIAYPYWPSVQKNLRNTEICKWEIEVDSGKEIIMNYIDLNLPSSRHNYYGDECNSNYADVLNIKVQSGESFTTEKVCRKISPKYTQFTGKAKISISLQMATSRDHVYLSKSGFVIGYVIFDKAHINSTKIKGNGTSFSPVISGILVGIIFFLFAGVIFFRYRSRLQQTAARTERERAIYVAGTTSEGSCRLLTMEPTVRSRAATEIEDSNVTPSGARLHLIGQPPSYNDVINNSDGIILPPKYEDVVNT